MITKIATQGRFGNGMGVEFAETFWLHYTRDGVNWMQWRNKYGEYVSQPQQMRSDDSQHNSASFFVCNFGHTRHFSHDLTPLLCYFLHTAHACFSLSLSGQVQQQQQQQSYQRPRLPVVADETVRPFFNSPLHSVPHHFETIYILVVRSFCKLATPLSCSCHCCFCQFFLSARVQINLQIISVAYQCLFGDKRIWETFWSLVRRDALHWCVIIVRVLELVLCWQMTGIIMSNT